MHFRAIEFDAADGDIAFGRAGLKRLILQGNDRQFKRIPTALYIRLKAEN